MAWSSAGQDVWRCKLGKLILHIMKSRNVGWSAASKPILSDTRLAATDLKAAQREALLLLREKLLSHAKMISNV